MNNQIMLFNSKNKGWSEEEKQVLIKEIEKSPNNLQNAFNRTAEVLSRTPSSCAQQYYRYLKHEYNIIGLSSVEGKVINIKNTPVSKDETAELRFQVIIAAVNKLNKVEKRAVLQHILNL